MLGRGQTFEERRRQVVSGDVDLGVRFAAGAHPLVASAAEISCGRRTADAADVTARAAAGDGKARASLASRSTSLLLPRNPDIAWLSGPPVSIRIRGATSCPSHSKENHRRVDLPSLGNISPTPDCGPGTRGGRESCVVRLVSFSPRPVPRHEGNGLGTRSAAP